jgi:hypothetical protein
LAINEFTSARYAVLPAIGGDQTLGRIYLDDFGLPHDAAWLWGSIGFLVAYAVLLVGASIAAFVFVRYDRNIGSARTIDGDADNPALLLESARLGKCARNSASSASIVPADLDSPTLGLLETDASSISFDAATLAFRDLRYSVRLSRSAAAAHGGCRTRDLLRGVCGYAEPGRLLALMGASGAGEGEGR